MLYIYLIKLQTILSIIFAGNGRINFEEFKTLMMKHDGKRESSSVQSRSRDEEIEMRMAFKVSVLKQGQFLPILFITIV